MSALCKIALRLPHPVRFDVFCFLKGLADVADVFPLVKHGGRGYAAHGGGNGEGSLKGYWQEQEELAERIETGATYTCIYTYMIGMIRRGGGWVVGGRKRRAVVIFQLKNRKKIQSFFHFC